MNLKKLKELLLKLEVLLSQLFPRPNYDVPVKDLPMNLPDTPKPTLTPLEQFCSAIKLFEGWSYGTRSYKNNNPGNCRYSSVGYAAKYGVVKRDAQNFAIFKDYATGWLYLLNLIDEKVGNHPEWDFNDFFQNYAPSSDGNNPVRYAAFVASRCGVEPSLKVSKFIH